MTHGSPVARKTPSSRGSSQRSGIHKTLPRIKQRNIQPANLEIVRRLSDSSEQSNVSTQTADTSSSEYSRRASEERDARQLALAKIVGAARTDPFNCWPVSWYRDLDTNFDFLVNSFGPSVFGYLRNTHDFDIFRTQTRLALNDPASFHALMIMSTQRKGNLAGQIVPGMSVLWHKIEAIRLVKERLESGDIEKCTTEGTIYAVMVLMGIGALWNAVDQNEFSSSALDMLVVRKGGLKVISEAHPVLETSIFGMVCMNTGLLRSDLYTINDPHVLDQPQDSKGQMWSLLGFLRATTSLKQKIPHTMSKVQSMFATNTAAYSLLNDTPNHPGIDDERQRRLQTRLRAHVVVYVFSILIWASPFQVQEFLHHLDFVNNHVPIWRNSLRMFAWALVCNVSKGSLMFSMQAWQSYEILCAGVRLPDDLRSNILKYSMDLLTGKNERVQASELMARIRSVMFRSSPDTQSQE